MAEYYIGKKKLAVCVCLVVSLLAGRSHAMSVDGTVWEGDHSGFTVDDAYGFFSGEVAKQTNAMSVVQGISAHMAKGERYYYVSVLWGAKETNGLFRANGRQCFEVRGPGKVVPSPRSPITNELQVSSVSYPEIMACLSAFGVDIRRVHEIERHCIVPTNETWSILLDPSQESFTISPGEVKELIEIVSRHPPLPNGEVLPQVREFREKIKRTEEKKLRAKYGEIKNDSYVGMSAAEFEAALGRGSIGYEPEPASGYLGFKPLNLRMKTRCGHCWVGDGRVLVVWQVCGANGEWTVIKDVEFSRRILFGWP